MNVALRPDLTSTMRQKPTGGWGRLSHAGSWDLVRMKSRTAPANDTASAGVWRTSSAGATSAMPFCMPPSRKPTLGWPPRSYPTVNSLLLRYPSSWGERSTPSMGAHVFWRPAPAREVASFSHAGRPATLALVRFCTSSVTLASALATRVCFSPSCSPYGFFHQGHTTSQMWAGRATLAKRPLSPPSSTRLRPTAAVRAATASSLSPATTLTGAPAPSTCLPSSAARAASASAWVKNVATAKPWSKFFSTRITRSPHSAVSQRLARAHPHSSVAGVQGRPLIVSTMAGPASAPGAPRPPSPRLPDTCLDTLIATWLAAWAALWYSSIVFALSNMRFTNATSPCHLVTSAASMMISEETPPVKPALLRRHTLD
mmetsp:Transcript_23308/g.59600  ORF Transcript_23308/g.59600 Transcript_23308/m.59600 type:complete len:372 (-) Transcript_23308:38-1153(-)